MTIDLATLHDITNHFYAITNRGNFIHPSSMSNDINVFINFTNELMFKEYFAEIVEDGQHYELPEFYGLYYPVDEEHRDCQSSLTIYTRELNRIKEKYNICDMLQRITNDSISEDFINNNSDILPFTKEEITMTLIYIKSTIAALHCELTNNPVGYFKELNN